MTWSWKVELALVGLVAPWFVVWWQDAIQKALAKE